MLLNFSAENFKTFKDKFVFSMEPAPKQKGLDYSIFKKRINGKDYKGLSTAVVYGPNAAGKSNLIGAIEAFEEIILRGNIKNTPPKSPNWAAFKLELIPNSTSEEAKPVSFGIKFIVDDLVVEYTLVLDLGLFAEALYERKVLFEELKVNEKPIFTRSDSLQLQNLHSIRTLVNDDVLDETKLPFLTSLAEKGLEKTDLFLSNGFRVIFAKKLVDKIGYWLGHQLIVIPRSDVVEYKGVQSKSYTPEMEKLFTRIANKLGSDTDKLGYATFGDSNQAVLTSIIKSEKNKDAFIPSELYESYGTIRMVNLFPLLLMALRNGGALLVDEFDASIHPMVIMNIIKIFHDDEINVNHAQLIFNTHNPIFLNANLLRRDEIKFVERDKETHFSRHYSLADFKTSGANGVRKGEDYLKNYFIDSYGAIDDVDLSGLLDGLILKKEDKTNEHAG